MKNEFEATYLNIPFDQTVAQLQARGAVQDHPKTLMSRLIFENTATRSKHGWVRLRSEAKSTTLTYKQVDSNEHINGTHEIEFIVSDIDAARDFLIAIGLEKMRFQQNYRERWLLDDITYDFDTWPGLNTFLEIEGNSEQAVRSASKELGLDYDTAKFGSIDTIYKTELGRDILSESTLMFE